MCIICTPQNYSLSLQCKQKIKVMKYYLFYYDTKKTFNSLKQALSYAYGILAEHDCGMAIEDENGNYYNIFTGEKED